MRHILPAPDMILLAVGLILTGLVLKLSLEPLRPEVFKPEVSKSVANNQQLIGNVSVPQELRELGALSAFKEISDRTLFNPSRRAIAFVRADDATATHLERIVFPKLFIRGIIMNPEEAIALVQVADNADLARVKVGSDIEGWTVKKIDRQGVIFSHGGEENTVLIGGETQSGDFVSVGGAGKGRISGVREKQSR